MVDVALQQLPSDERFGDTEKQHVKPAIVPGLRNTATTNPKILFE